jgi:DNA repair exonuclease SbcCD ATPase subunit
MTRIVGFLEGANGPLNGRLYVKPGGAFIGAPEKDLSFKVVDGEVDIELPPCPPGMPYYVDWKNTGDISRLRYVERWRVPAAPEVTIEDVRGLVKSGPGRAQVASRKGDLLEAKMLKGEINELTEALQRLEQENAKLLKEVTIAESKAAAAQAKSASMVSELTTAKRDAIDARLAQQEVVIEKVVEKAMTPVEFQETISEYRQQLELLAQENEALKKEAADAFSLTTHYASLHSQIDRLTMEKQQLLSRIDELKRPKRSTTSLRNEAIANLDRLISG